MAINKNKVMDAARKARDKGQVDKAIKEYLKIVREDPKDVRVWLKIGDLYAKKGAKPEATETYLKVAKFYSEQGFYLKAVAVYKQILKLDPRLVEVNLKLAELYRQLGLLSDAMQHFEMVAAFFHREGKTKEALATIRQLVDLDPENVATRIKLAELYSKEGMTGDAVTEFGHACDYLRKHNRQDDFIKVAERLLWHKPENIDLNRELAGLYLRRTDPRRALQKLQTCFKANPRDVETLGLLAQAFQALDQKGKTVSVLKEMARVLVDAGKRREAEDVHRKILQFVPGDPDSRAFLGQSKVGPAHAPAPPVAEEVLEPAPRRTAARGVMGNPTGSMPLVNPPELDDEPEPLPPTTEDARGAVHLLASEGETDLIAELSLDDENFDSADSSVHGEVHADEIVKILTETDVYVKYGLHQKALEHLQKVFSLDAHNLEARERLKDLLLAQGRATEAVAELCRMAEQVAPAQPEQAELYLREAVRISPHDPQVPEMAARYRLDLTGAEEVEIVDDMPAGDSGAPLRLERSPAGSGARPVDDELDFGDLDFDSEVSDEPGASGGGAGGHAGAVPRASSHFESDGFEFELEDDESQVESSVSFGGPAPALARPDSVIDLAQAGQPDGNTMEVQLDQVEEAVSIADLDSDDLDFDAPAHDFDAPAADDFDAPAHDFGAPAHLDPAGGAMDVGADVDDPLGDFGAPAAPRSLGGLGEMDVDMGHGVGPGGMSHASEPAGLDPLGSLDHDPSAMQPMVPEDQLAPPMAMSEDDLALDDLPFDPADARRFDAEPGFQEGDAAPGMAEPHAQEPDPGAASDFGLGYPEPPAQPHIGAGPGDPTHQNEIPPASLDSGFVLDGDSEVRDAGEVPTVGNTSLEDDLDEADFFMNQALWDEARDILHGLLERYPGHPLVLAKLRDVDAMASGQMPDPDGADELPGGDELGFDELGGAALGSEGVAPSPAHMAGAPQSRPAKPVVLLEKPIEDSDADTHYDLGLAYKEMGLHDEAIKAFNKVLTVSGREVQCHLMIGLCHKEQGNLSEAINQFKAGLYVDKITQPEKFGLYYEIGNCYEDLEDPQEALYYYEMVLKRDGGYRDVAQRVASIRSRSGGNGAGGSAGSGTGKRQSTLDAETDAALDDLKR